MKLGKAYLFFDEIQEVTDWEKCINSFKVEFDCDIYITGLYTKLLWGELFTCLTGSYVKFIIYPFSYMEFMELYQTVFPNTDARELFCIYLIVGVMPYLSNLYYEEEPCRRYLQDLLGKKISMVNEKYYIAD